MNKVIPISQPTRPPALGSITAAQAQQILQQAGLSVSLEQAAGITQFLYKLAFCSLNTPTLEVTTKTIK